MNTPCIYWLEQSALDVPTWDDWLSDEELTQLAAMRIPKRRQDWRLGRWTAKRAAALCHGLPTSYRRIQIRPTVEGAPRLYVDGKPAPQAISLSHSNNKSL